MICRTWSKSSLLAFLHNPILLSPCSVYMASGDNGLENFSGAMSLPYYLGKFDPLQQGEMSIGTRAIEIQGTSIG